MKKQICLFIIALSASTLSAFAHTDMIIPNSFGNVRTTIITGHHYEKINKVAIFGQLAEKLSREMNYSGLIQLNFHHRLRNVEPEFFISYDSIRYWDSNAEKWQTRKGIVVLQFAREFHAETTLKLLEYAISNRRNVRRTQREVPYCRNRFYRIPFSSIDISRIERILNAPNSRLLNNMMQQRIDRPEENFREGVSYFWHNNRYYVFWKDWNRERRVLFDVNNIYDFHRFSRWYAVIFDTDSTFYAVNAQFVIPCLHSSISKPKISERQVIENTFGFHRPFQVHNIGRNKFSIHFEHHRQRGSGNMSRYILPGSRTLIYWLEEDLLIQNLGNLLWENRVVETEEK